MNSVLPVIIALAILGALGFLVFLKRSMLKFYLAGIDSGFRFSEIKMLWKLAKASKLDDPSKLFWSVPAIEKSIGTFLLDAKSAGTEHLRDTQDFLTKLYKYRTKIQLENRDKSGMSSTKSLDAGQKIIVVLSGVGVFTSEVVHCSRELIISLPRPKKENSSVLEGYQDWEGKTVSVYLMKKNDAHYVFDTIVNSSNLYNGKLVLHLAHTDKLTRMQKRRSVRCECHIAAKMYIINSEFSDLKKFETGPGLKCLLEDISEDGALIRIGGRGINDLKLKIQFSISGTFILMWGHVCGVEYDEAKNQSLLHFECISIEQHMRNAILSYVYDILPQNEKDALEAMNLAETAESNNTAEQDKTENFENDDPEINFDIDTKKEVEKNGKPDESNSITIDDDIFKQVNSGERNAKVNKN